MRKLWPFAFYVLLFAAIAFVSPFLVLYHDVLFQYSTLGSLLAGVHDGGMTYAEIKGKFRHVKTRSVPRQAKPYPPLLEVPLDFSADLSII